MKENRTFRNFLTFLFPEGCLLVLTQHFLYGSAPHGFSPKYPSQQMVMNSPKRSTVRTKLLWRLKLNCCNECRMCNLFKNTFLFVITPAQAIISSGLASCTCSLQVPSPNFFACSPTQLLEGPFKTCRSHPFTLLLNTVQQHPRVLSGKSKFLTRTYGWLLRGLPQPTAEPSGLYIQSLATNLLSATGICQTPTLSELLH